MTARIARARLAWILPFDRQAARRRRHDRRPLTYGDAQHLKNVAVARMPDCMQPCKWITHRGTRLGDKPPTNGGKSAD